MNSPLRTVRRKYRRYRADNRYNAPLTIFIVDLGISISKLVLVGLALLTAWTIAV